MKKFFLLKIKQRIGILFLIQNYYHQKNIKGLLIFGDSLTDGRFSNVDKHERWPDFLFKKLEKEKIDIAINYQGISGSFLTTTRKERFENDIIKQRGLNI